MDSENEYTRFSRGAIQYFNKLDDDSKHYHFCKPFVGGPDFSPFFQDFYAFLNIVQVLDMAPRSKILDVGCGTGWISMYLAKLGHTVVGIDISGDFISIAEKLKENEKVFPFPNQTELTCEFFIHDIDNEPFFYKEKFDVVILYSALHHFVYPKKVLKSLIDTNLKNNGKIMIYEGVKPPADSMWDKENLELMDKYDTLERPFEPEELHMILTECGYNRITFHEPINGLFLRDESSLKKIQLLFSNPLTCNAVLAFKPAESLSAEIILKTTKYTFSPGETITLIFEIRNTGDITWKHQSSGGMGPITLGGRLYKDSSFISDDVPRSFLPKDISPNENIVIEWSGKAPLENGNYSLLFDMIFEGHAWFQTQGSKVFSYDFVVKNENPGIDYHYRDSSLGSVRNEKIVKNMEYQPKKC